MRRIAWCRAAMLAMLLLVMHIASAFQLQAMGPAAFPIFEVTPQQEGASQNPAPVQSQPATPSKREAPQKLYFHPYSEYPLESTSDQNSSVYVPLDSWIYPAVSRLYSMGYIDSLYLGMRPWTRRSILHALEASRDKVENVNEEAEAIIDSLLREFEAEQPDNISVRENICCLESVYTRIMGVRGLPLRDSYHIGQTIVNDYGRPYQAGFNNITGFSGMAERGRFSLYVRGEYQHSPPAAGYSQALAAQLSFIDEIPYVPPHVPQATIPAGPIAAANNIRLLEANLSFHLAGHEISGGKTDAWLGPAQGGAMAWSNNAENIYSFRINRVEPLYIPLISRLAGPLRYDFFYGSLKGHTSPNSPWVHAEMFSFKPTVNLEFAFERTVIFGGKGHEPVTLHTFLRSFFSLSDVTDFQTKNSAQDPGARFSDFSFSYRLPLVRKYFTLYADSIAHDDVTPISAPRRAAYRTGLYLSHIPHAERFDFRVEAVSTDPGVSRSNKGQFNYYEAIQRQGYTNQGFIMGDWIGREAKGGQAWLTYYLSGNESLQLEYLNKKTPKDFMPGGVTQNSLKFSVVKRLGADLELNAWVQHERWIAPVYVNGQEGNTIGAVQVTYFPKLHSFGGR